MLHNYIELQLAVHILMYETADACFVNSQMPDWVGLISYQIPNYTVYGAKPHVKCLGCSRSGRRGDECSWICLCKIMYLIHSSRVSCHKNNYME